MHRDNVKNEATDLHTGNNSRNVSKRNALQGCTGPAVEVHETSMRHAGADELVVMSQARQGRSRRALLKGDHIGAPPQQLLLDPPGWGELAEQ